MELDLVALWKLIDAASDLGYLPGERLEEYGMGRRRIGVRQLRTYRRRECATFDQQAQLAQSLDAALRRQS